MKAFVFDFETTGLVLHPDAKDKVQPRIIEIGAVILNSKGKIEESMSQIVNPGMLIEPVITKITGLTDEDLKEQPPIGEFLPALLTMLAKCDVMIAHNLAFDKAMLELELARNQVHLRQRQQVHTPRWPRLEICTVQEYKELWGRRPKLTELYEHICGEPLKQTHRALDDVLALARIVVESGLMKRLGKVAR